MGSASDINGINGDFSENIGCVNVSSSDHILGVNGLFSGSLSADSVTSGSGDFTDVTVSGDLSATSGEFTDSLQVQDLYLTGTLYLEGSIQPGSPSARAVEDEQPQYLCITRQGRIFASDNP